MNQVKKPACPVCGESDPNAISFIEQNAAVNRIQCLTCRTVYFDREPPVIPSYDLSYNHYFLRAGDIRKAGIMAAYLADLALSEWKSPSILEAGTGNGLTAFLLNSMGIRTETVELDKAFAMWLTTHLNLMVHVSPFESFESKNKYNMIYSSHVIEHVKNPRAFVQNAFDLLDSGGIAVIETPDVQFIANNSRRWHHLDTRNPYEHISLLSIPALYLMAVDAKFEDIRIESLKDFQSMRLIARKPHQ